MNSGPSFLRLLQKTLVALLVCAGLVVVCYLYVDRPVAFYVHRRGWAEYSFLKWLTYPPPILQAWTPVVLAGLAVRRAFGPFRRWEWTLLVACVSIVLADQFRVSLGYVFGRTWPETWTHDNPSLIRDGVYGFHPFHGGRGYESFPSGHATRTLALATIVWIAYPGWRWACGLASVAVAAGLIGTDYHFVSDVIAGGFVGRIVGTYTAQFGGLGGVQRAAGPSDEALQATGPAGDRRER